MTTTTMTQTMPMTIDPNIKPLVQSMIASHAAFWAPRHVWGSRDLKYIPYLFWLVESALPRRIVQIGLDDGITFLSLCQAVDKLRLDASCIGLYLERDERLPQDFLNIQKGFYADISCLECFKPDSSSDSSNPAEIDMLVLGRAISDDVLTELRTELLPRLNDGAAIIILNASGSSKSANAEGIMRALREKYTLISALDDADAPVVLIKGSPGSERLRKMTNITARSPEHLLLRQIFLRLGQGIEDAELARQRKRALEVVQEKTDQLTQTLEAYETQIASLRADVKSRWAIEETHLEKIAIQMHQLTQLQSQEASQSAEIEALREKLTEAQEKRQAFYARSNELQAERDQLAQDLAARTDDLASLGADYEARFTQLQSQEASQSAEIEALREKLTEAQEKRQAFYARSTELQAERDQLAQDLAARTDDLASLGADYEARFTQLQSQEASQSAEIEALREKLTEAQEKRQAFYARSTELQAERDKLLSTVDERYMDIAVLSSDAERRISLLEKELNIEKFRFKKMMQSSSWRYTAPLRKIKNML